MAVAMAKAGNSATKSTHTAWIFILILHTENNKQSL